jgi:hypothetical protein
MPLMGVGSLDRRLRAAWDMGGTLQRRVLVLDGLVLLQRTSDQPPYDGEMSARGCPGGTAPGPIAKPVPTP